MPSLATRILRALVVLVGGAILLSWAATAQAKTTKPVPADFFGVVAGDATLDAKQPAGEYKRMRRAHVGSVSATTYWRIAQPYATAADVPASLRARYPLVDGIPTDFTRIDQVYANAAANGLRVLPVVIGAPPWARLDPNATWSPPRDPEVYGHFVRTMVRRYGAKGTFWKTHPKLPALPTRGWQIWNEPTGVSGPDQASVFWDAPKPYQPRYIAMLKAARTAIHGTDPAGQVLLGGIFGRSWITIKDLYDKGARSLFDGVAIHQFTLAPSNLIVTLQRVRAVMDAAGDKGKKIFLTEFSWPSALEHVPKKDRYGFETTQSGEAKRVRESLTVLAAQRGTLGLAQIYWFAWSTTDTGTYSFDYAGLRHTLPSGKVVSKPAEEAYRTIAGGLQGCKRKRPPAACRAAGR